MSLRDYFAGQAIAHQEVRFVIKVYPRGKGKPDHVEMPPMEWTEDMRAGVHEWCAKDAYLLADAMLKARGEEQ